MCGKWVNSPLIPAQPSRLADTRQQERRGVGGFLTREATVIPSESENPKEPHPAAFLYDGKGIKFPVDDIYSLYRLSIFPSTHLGAELAAYAGS